jgi:acyl carrier protein
MEPQRIRETLRQIFEEEMDLSLGDLRDEMVPAEEFALDSVDFVSLIMRVEERFHIRLKNEELTKAKTIGALVNLVESKVAECETPTSVRRAA